MKLKIFFLTAILLTTATVQANEYTHTIGNTGYMIQDAMWAKANKLDHRNYQQAVKLQNEAKDYLRGTGRKKRNLAKAMELTKQAYQLAKTARDNSLAAQNIKVSR